MYIYNNEFRLASNIITATATVLVYDAIITFGDEVSHIWCQPWTLGSVLYLVNRYLPFIDTMMALYLQMSVTTPEKCHAYYKAITWMIACGLMVSELIVLLRTWAIWHRDRKVFMILFGMSSLTFGPGIALTYLEIVSLKFEPVPPGGIGCNLVKASRLIMVTFVLILLSETVVVALTIRKGIEYLRSSKKSWVKRIYRDGAQFYVYLLVITIINMVTPLVAPEPLYKNWLAVPQRVFHSIICNRVILMISKQRTMHSGGQISLTQRTLSKGNYTSNALDTGIITDVTRDDELHLDEDDHELTSYRTDWTMR